MDLTITILAMPEMALLSFWSFPLLPGLCLEMERGKLSFQ